MATHSSILAQKIPWTGEPGGVQPMGSQRVRQNPAQHSLTASKRNVIFYYAVFYLCEWKTVITLKVTAFRKGYPVTYLRLQAAFLTCSKSNRIQRLSKRYNMESHLFFSFTECPQFCLFIHHTQKCFLETTYHLSHKYFNMYL